MLLLVGKQTGVRSVYDRSVNLDALLPFCHCLRDTLVNKGSELKNTNGIHVSIPVPGENPPLLPHAVSPIGGCV